MKAILRQVRISPKKANLIASLVRNMKVLEAIDILNFTPKKGAPILKKIIESAAANAENNFKQKKESLYLKEIIVTEGPTYKRGVPISRGRVHPILKKTSHITVKVESRNQDKKTETTAKTAPEPAAETKVKTSVKSAKKTDK